MRFSGHSRSHILAACAVVLALLAMIPARSAYASDGNPNPGALPPHSTAFGKTYNEWAVSWWQYVVSIPQAVNPLFDPTGAGCGVAQSGSVFFLVGAAGSGTVTRDQCVVPAGKALFFPLVNAFDAHVPGDGLDTPDLVWKDLLSYGWGSFSNFHASVDGVPVSDLDPSSTPYRACAAPIPGCASAFSVQLPAGNYFGVTPGAYAPTVEDGYYLLLAPLSAGPHTINFGGAGYFGGPFTQDITYHLVVAPQ